jgi:hypothetical protein
MISDQWDSNMPPLNLWNFSQRDKYVYNITETAMELYHLRSIDDPLTKVIKDDPVRPHIPLSQRINETAEILILKAGEEILAATCLQWLTDIPANEQDLIDFGKDKNIAVFYTIWSYAPGAGAKLLQQAAEWLLKDHADIKGIVTLSPQTEMARKFHLKNGAKIHKENPTSVNYEYYLKE